MSDKKTAPTEILCCRAVCCLLIIGLAQKMQGYLSDYAKAPIGSQGASILGVAVS